MSGSLTMWGRERVLEAFFMPDVFVPVTSVEIALCLALPSYTATGADLIEPDAGEYARVTMGMSSADWGLTGFGEVVNLNEIIFPQVAANFWALIFAWAMVDPVSDQCIHVAQIANPFQPMQGMIPRFGAGMINTGIYDDAETV